jgi:hypothetical protein
MNARDALFEDRRIPGQVHVHQGRSMLQIEARAASVCGQEHAAGGSSRNRSTSAGRFSDSTPPWKLT